MGEGASIVDDPQPNILQCVPIEANLLPTAFIEGTVKEEVVMIFRASLVTEDTG